MVHIDIQTFPQGQFALQWNQIKTSYDGSLHPIRSNFVGIRCRFVRLYRIASILLYFDQLLSALHLRSAWIQSWYDGRVSETSATMSSTSR